jgi:hypothetical protein
MTSTSPALGELCGVNDLIFNYVLPGENPVPSVEKTAIPLPFLLLTVVIFIGSYIVSSIFVTAFTSIIKIIKEGGG